MHLIDEIEGWINMYGSYKSRGSLLVLWIRPVCIELFCFVTLNVLVLWGCLSYKIVINCKLVYVGELFDQSNFCIPRQNYVIMMVCQWITSSLLHIPSNTSNNLRRDCESQHMRSPSFMISPVVCCVFKRLLIVRPYAKKYRPLASSSVTSGNFRKNKDTWFLLQTIAFFPTTELFNIVF